MQWQCGILTRRWMCSDKLMQFQDELTASHIHMCPPMCTSHPCSWCFDRGHLVHVAQTIKDWQQAVCICKLVTHSDQGQMCSGYAWICAITSSSSAWGWHQGRPLCHRPQHWRLRTAPCSALSCRWPPRPWLLLNRLLLPAAGLQECIVPLSMHRLWQSTGELTNVCRGGYMPGVQATPGELYNV